MSDTFLTIGMPSGSLANPGRGGNLIQLLEDAGFRTSGYDSGGPSKFYNHCYLYGWDGRPQEFGSQLGVDEIDVAISGDDWIQERILELNKEYQTDINLEKVLSLNRGKVRIVGIVNSSISASKPEQIINALISQKDIITVVSELPYLALSWVQEILKRTGKTEYLKEYAVQKYKTPPKIKKGVLVYETWGKTEAKIKSEGADLGVEITQTGSAIKNYGLNIIDEVMTSEAGVWINSKLKNDKDKSELLKMFIINLYGAVYAENKVMILFNVPNAQLNDIISYLEQNNLFGDEPTLNTGKEFTEISIQVDLGNKENPLAKIRYELALRKAKNINTIPINSSIPSIDVIGF